MAQSLARVPARCLITKNVTAQSQQPQRNFIGESYRNLKSKLKVIYFGADRPKPTPGPDRIWEGMLKREPLKDIPFDRRSFAKGDWWKLRVKEIKWDKNRRYRNLDQQITSGVYGNRDHANKY